MKKTILATALAAMLVGCSLNPAAADTSKITVSGNGFSVPLREKTQVACHERQHVCVLRGVWRGTAIHARTLSALDGFLGIPKNAAIDSREVTDCIDERAGHRLRCQSKTTLTPSKKP